MWVCRIVITDLQGAFLTQIGGNGAQLVDGTFTEAAFNRPQGVAYSQKRDCLYVADTENHALREVCPSGCSSVLVVRPCSLQF